MNLSNLKKVLLVTVVGSVMTACSTPNPNGDYDYTDDGRFPGYDAGKEGKEIDLTGVVTEEVIVEPANLENDIFSMNAEQLKAFVAGKVLYFAYDRSDISPEEYVLIQAHARLMSLEPGLKLQVTGNCDERGSREYNLALGERRAISVKDALVAEGVSGYRIDTLSYGEDMPANDAHNETAWAENRRAVFEY